eukprot:PhF_6_TR25145/c0_g1_i4/m.34637
MGPCDFVDNQMYEVGWLQPGMKHDVYTGSTAVEHDELFSTDFLRTARLMKRLQSSQHTSCKLTIAHIRVDDSHKVLPTEKPIHDARYQQLRDDFETFNTALIHKMEEYFDANDVVMKYTPDRKHKIVRSQYETDVQALKGLVTKLGEDILEKNSGQTSEGRTAAKSLAKQIMDETRKFSVVHPMHNVVRSVAFKIQYSPGGVPFSDSVCSELRDVLERWDEIVHLSH